MNMKGILWAGKSMVEKSLVLFTLLFCLSIIGRAYSSNSTLGIENDIPSDSAYYSEKGYTVKASGKGHCMYGVYSRDRCTVVSYGSRRCCSIGIHYASVGIHCVAEESWQDFEIINNDTGHIVGRLRWKKSVFKSPNLEFLENPDSFMSDRTGLIIEGDKLNVWTD